MVIHQLAFFGKENLKNCYLKSDGKSTHVGMSLRAQKIGLLSVLRGRFLKMVGKKQIMGPMWKNQHKGIDLEDTTPSIDQDYMGCTQRSAKVDPQQFSLKPSCSTNARRQGRLTKKIRRKEIVVGKDHCLEL